MKGERTSRSRRSRTILLFVLLELFFILLICRVFFLQCISGSELRRRAEEQYNRDICVGAKRGSIYDRNLQPLAVNVTTRSLYADPTTLKQRKPIAESLAPLLGLPEKDIERRLNYDRRFVWLKRKLSDEIADDIGSLGFKGLGFIEEEKRYYPKGILAAHVLGFVDIDNKGLDGIEKAYNSYMRGSLQQHEILADSLGRGLTPQEVGFDAQTRGHDLVLTLDEVIQHIAEVEISQACQEAQAKSGSVIAMNPQTGEILALANYPTYNLNAASHVSDKYKRNRAIRDLYEPGSAFKVVTAAAIVNENLVAADEKIDCESGIYSFDGYTVHDISKHEMLTFSEIIEQSSNIGTVKVASRLGDKCLYSYMESFGLTGKTGIDLSERAGFVRPLESWTKHSMVAIPFGQEFAITPLQMLCSMNVIANDGIMMKPFIVQSVRNGTEIIEDFFPQEISSPVSPETASIVRGMLTRAVENGTGNNASIYGYSVAGKTGTAQKASASGGYERGKYVSSFVGFISGKGITISIIAVINEPQGRKYTGGAVACPVFREVATQIMQYLNIGQRNYAMELKPTG